jgi:hypothetical protein
MLTFDICDQRSCAGLVWRGARAAALRRQAHVAKVEILFFEGRLDHCQE